jgi:hypothetical protein
VLVRPPDFLSDRGPNGYHYLPDIIAKGDSFMGWSGFEQGDQVIAIVNAVFEHSVPWYDDTPDELVQTIADLTCHYVAESLGEVGEVPPTEEVRLYAYYLYQLLTTPHWKKTGYRWSRNPETGGIVATKESNS